MYEVKPNSNQKIIITLSLLLIFFFAFSMQSCSEKGQKDNSSQLNTFTPKITKLDTALIDSSSILPDKSSKKNEDLDPTRPHTLNRSN